MTSEEYIQVEKFAEGLRKCYSSRIADNPEGAGIVKATLNYCLGVLDIHLQLARLEFEKSAFEHEQYFKEKK